jgi:RNA polymerase sigma factor (sigma-70 family)
VPDLPLGIVTDYLRRVSPSAEETDAELLSRYVRERQGEAFALLVQRHGPMVLGVCRRALGLTPDADDAFQATFLALARNAGRVRGCLPGWLYRVAVRSSRKALRRTHPSPGPDAADPSDPFATVEWQDVRRVLDEELSQLPDRWRTPLVLCHLNGLTRDEAAARLGWSLRTLHRRLDEGRQALRRRLSRRGLGPAILATVVLTPDALQAHVPARLARDTAAQGSKGAIVSESVRALVPRISSSGGWTMKAVVSALFVVGGTAVVLSTRQPAAAVPVPRVPAEPPALVLAPAKREKPPEDELSKKVCEAQKKGITYLKAAQTDQGLGVWNWETSPVAAGQQGGASALALLALLESDVKTDDPVVARGLKYLRTVEPRHTYVVGLQTQVFCKANQKEDADLIKRNVKWLEEAGVRNLKGELFGWSYTTGPGQRADNSNSRYAVAGLYAAHKAGFKTAKADFWKDLRELYLRTQRADGGWGYVPEAAKSTQTMSGSGLICLFRAKEIIGTDDKAADGAIDGGLTWVANNLQLKIALHTFYNFDVVAELGRASERSDLGEKGRKRDWYREGAEWLLTNQKIGGEWQINVAVDSNPVLSTSFALRFLASRPD